MTVYKTEPRHPIGKWTFIDFPTPQTSDDPINFSKTWNLAAWPRLPLCVDVFFLEGSYASNLQLGASAEVREGSQREVCTSTFMAMCS